jgi:O-antigen/teichoic acid export membrane protein
VSRKKGRHHRARRSHRAAGAERSGIVKAFSSLVGAQVIAALLGYLFWVVIARGMSSEEIAVAHASVSVMSLIGIVASLGYGTLLLSELPAQRAGQRRTTLRNAFVVVLIASAVLGIGWCLAAPLIGDTFQRAVSSPGSAALLVVGAGASSVGYVLDQAVVGLGRPGLQVTRNVVASSLKFPLVLLLIMAGYRTHLAVLTAWVLPLVLSLFVVWRRGGLSNVAGIPDRLGDHVRRYARAALLNHALNLALAASSLFLPLIAAGLLSAREYAAFSLTWLVATFVFTPAFMLAIALFATSVDDELAYRLQARRTLPSGIAIGVLCYAGAALLARPIMATFGQSYVAQGVVILRIVALGGIALVVKDHLFALLRVRRQMGIAALIGLLGLVLELSGAAVGALLHGATGLSAGWLCALYLQALVMVPFVLPNRRHNEAPSTSDQCNETAVSASAVGGVVATARVRSTAITDLGDDGVA